MNLIFYSAKTGGFYDAQLHRDCIPPDAVEIEHDYYESLITGQSEGKQIAADNTGFPVLRSNLLSSEALLRRITIECDKRWRSGFPVLIGGETKWFHSDEFSLTQHLGLKDAARDLLAAGGALSDNITIAGEPVVWSTMDGSQVTITAQVAFDLVAAAGIQQALVFAASQAHKQAISSAQDLTAYDIQALWPPVFND